MQPWKNFNKYVVAKYIFLLIGALVIGSALFHYTGPGQVLERFMPGCIQCHVRVTLHLDGIGASRLSKGTHPINEAKIRPTKGYGSKYKKFYKKAGLSGETCKMCHPRQHSSWLTSAHGRSFTNPIFRHAFGRDKLGWCLNCHAPLWEPQKMDPVAIAKNPDDSALYADGITCVVCHLRDGVIISGNDFSGKEDELYHAVRYDPLFKTERFCAGCHQFNFVDRIHPVIKYEGDNHPMQNVIREYEQVRSHAQGQSIKPDYSHKNFAHTKPENNTQTQQSCIGCHFYEGDHSLKSEAKLNLKEKIQVSFQMEAIKRSSKTILTQKNPDHFTSPHPSNKPEHTKEDTSLDITSNSHYQTRSHSASGEYLNNNPAYFHQTIDGIHRWKLKVAIHIPRIAHNFPTGDLFRILSIYAYNQKQQKILQYDFRKEVRVVDRVVIQDTTIKPIPGHEGAYVKLDFRLTQKPTRCKLIYRLQGAIESEISEDFHDPSVLQEVLYEGTCQGRP